MFTEYIKSRPGQVEQAIKDFPCAFVPIGALEWHGPHLPLGLDGVKAENLLRLTAERLGKGILFPCIFFGAYNTMKFPFTYHFPRTIISRRLSDDCISERSLPRRSS
jgi:creatinine amidohydrolase/Fe(II)-dependent formamide hydrolase-like protein